MFNWLRTSQSAAFLLLAIRLYVGWTFLSAGWGKLTGEKPFDAAGFLQGALKKAEGPNALVQGWYADFLSNVAIPNVGAFNFLVPWGEFLVGVGLILGLFATFSAATGMFMNFNFLLAGAISNNPILILLAFLLLVGGANAGRIGGDAFVLPKLRGIFNNGRTTHSS